MSLTMLFPWGPQTHLKGTMLNQVWFLGLSMTLWEPDVFFPASLVSFSGLVSHLYSHATYWDGKKKQMSQLDALQEAVHWVWRVHSELLPASSQDSRQDSFSKGQFSKGQFSKEQFPKC